MKIKRKAIILFVNDLHRSREFYSQILGLKISMDFSSVVFFEEEIAIWELKSGEKLVDELGEEFYNTERSKNEIYFEIFDFDDFVKELKNKNIELLHDVYTGEHGQRAIRFYDPDRNIIEIGEPLEVFIRRDFDEGVPLDELSKKHILQEDEIRKLLNL